MADNFMPVWIAEHDDPEVGYVVNDRDDMQTNYDDAVDDNVIEPGVSFEEYLNQWYYAEMPISIFDGETAERIAWIKAQGI